MHTYSVTMGLGRMANHHEKTIEVKAEDQGRAVSAARMLYYDHLHKEIGRKAPILNKVLTIVSVKIIDHCL